MRGTTLARSLGVASLAATLFGAPSPSRADDADEAARLAIDATHGIAPQPSRVADTFRRARPVEAAQFEGMLLCDVEVEGESWDGSDPLGPVRRYMGRVELEARIRLPARTDPIRVLGPEDTNHVAFAIAGTSLGAGDVLSIELVDRDIFDDDPIATFSLTYQGSLPLTATNEHASIECRGTEADALASRIRSLVNAADDDLDDLETADPPSASLVGFRDDDADPTDAELAVYDLARVVGLADDRFLSRRDRLRDMQAQSIAAIAALVGRIRQTATPLATDLELSSSDVHLRVDKYDCEVDDVLAIHPELGLDAPMECALFVTLLSDRSASVPHTFHVTDALGNTAQLTRYGVMTDELARVRALRAADGETHVVFAVPIRHAVMLRVARRRSVQWFSVVPSEAPPATPATATPPAPAPTSAPEPPDVTP